MARRRGEMHFLIKIVIWPVSVVLGSIISVLLFNAFARDYLDVVGRIIERVRFLKPIESFGAEAIAGGIGGALAFYLAKITYKFLALFSPRKQNDEKSA